MSEHAEVKQEHHDWVHRAFPWYVCRAQVHTPQCTAKAQLLADYADKVRRTILMPDEVNKALIETRYNEGIGKVSELTARLNAMLEGKP